MRRPWIIVSLSLLLALVIGFAWFGRPQPEPEAGQASPMPSLNPLTERESPAPLAESTGEMPGTFDRTVNLETEGARPALREDHGYQPDEFARDRMQIFESFQQSVSRWTPQDFEQKSAERNQLSGREAYEVYVFLRSCLGQPESLEQVNRRIDRLAEIAERRPNRADGILGQIDSLQAGLERCEGIGSDGTGVPLMHDWLALSADLGFAQAQLAYHLSARWILSMQSDELFRQPQLVVDYRDRAAGYLRAAMLSGHPDALLEMARAIDDDIVFQRDPQAAFAYAYAAEQGGGGMEAETELFMKELEPELTAQQLREARERGRALCDRYCRG